MAIDIPDEKEIADRIQADFKSEIPAANPYLRDSLINSLIVAEAGVIFSFYQMLDKFLLPNIFPQTANINEYLEMWGEIKDVTKNPATQSIGYITAQGVDTTIIPIDTQFQTTDGITLKTLASATITLTNAAVTSITQVSGTATVTTTNPHNLATGITVTISGANEAGYNKTTTIVVTGLSTFTYSVDPGTPSPATGTIIATHTTASIQVRSVDFGQAANVEGGSQITVTSPIVGMEDTAYVQYNGITGGTDTETNENYRLRVLDVWKSLYGLFNVAAIETKAKEISGVTRVWVKEETPTTGKVTIYFTRDNDVPIIPSPAEIADVKNNILTIKPATTDDAYVIVSAPSAVNVNFTFVAISPDTTTMRTAIEASLKQLFLDDTNVGVNLLAAQYLGAIIDTVDSETGERLQTFTLSSPTGDVGISSGQLPVLGTVTF